MYIRVISILLDLLCFFSFFLLYVFALRLKFLLPHQIDKGLNGQVFDTFQTANAYSYEIGVESYPINNQSNS